MEEYQLEGEGDQCRGNVHGLRSTNWYIQNRQGDVKNSIGNGITKEIICITHGHELREEFLEGMGVPGGGGQKGKIGITVIA